jgi:hypothetical protein
MASSTSSKPVAGSSHENNTGKRIRKTEKEKIALNEILFIIKV